MSTDQDVTLRVNLENRAAAGFAAIKKDMEGLTSSLKTAFVQTKQGEKGLIELDSEMKKLADVANRLRNEIDNITDQLKLFGEQGLQAANALEEIADPVRRVVEGQRLLARMIRESTSELNQLQDAAKVRIAENNLRDMTDTLSRLSPAGQRAAAALGDVADVGRRNAVAAQIMRDELSGPGGIIGQFVALSDSLSIAHARFAALPPVAQGAVLGALGGLTAAAGLLVAGLQKLSAATVEYAAESLKLWREQSHAARVEQDRLDASTRQLNLTLGHALNSAGDVGSIFGFLTRSARETEAAVVDFNRWQEATRREGDFWNKTLARSVSIVSLLPPELQNAGHAILEAGRKFNELTHEQEAFYRSLEQADYKTGAFNNRLLEQESTIRALRAELGRWNTEEERTLRLRAQDVEALERQKLALQKMEQAGVFMGEHTADAVLSLRDALKSLDDRIAASRVDELSGMFLDLGKAGVEAAVLQGAAEDLIQSAEEGTISWEQALTSFQSLFSGVQTEAKGAKESTAALGDELERINALQRELDRERQDGYLLEEQRLAQIDRQIDRQMFQSDLLRQQIELEKERRTAAKIPERIDAALEGADTFKATVQSSLPGGLTSDEMQALREQYTAAQAQIANTLADPNLTGEEGAALGRVADELDLLMAKLREMGTINPWEQIGGVTLDITIDKLHEAGLVALETFGQIAVGEASMGDLGKAMVGQLQNLLKTLAPAFTQLGAALIATQTGNAIGLLAAGAALAFLAGTLSSFTAKGAAPGGRSTAGTDRLREIADIFRSQSTEEREGRTVNVYIDGDQLQGTIERGVERGMRRGVFGAPQPAGFLR